LDAVFRLVEAGPSQGAEARPLRREQATLALIRHTVAARLFDHSLLGQHLAFCAEAPTRLTIADLTYRRERGWLPQVCQLLGTLRTLSP
jgi:hypothetical protein